MEKNAVMINLSPEECMRIATGEQKALLRKLKPNLNTPFKVYILCSKSETRVFGNDKSFLTDSFKLLKSEKDFERTSCDTHYLVQGWIEKALAEIIEDTCSDYSSLYSYLAKKSAYAWYVSDLKFYDKSKSVSDFCKPDYKYNCFGS